MSIQDLWNILNSWFIYDKRYALGFKTGSREYRVNDPEVINLHAHLIDAGESSFFLYSFSHLII